MVISKNIVDKSKLLEASVLVASRGPNNTNYVCKGFGDGYVLSGVHFLLDLSGTSAIQPIIEEDGENFLVWNGEIYNKDENFVSDTEFLFCYLKNDKPLELLNGEFAIVFGNLKTGKIKMYTDAFATKPMFFGYHGNSVVISSYKTPIDSLGIGSAGIVKENTEVVVYLKENKLYYKPIITWDLRQIDKVGYGDWKDNFLEAVRNRALHGKGSNIFVPMSGGHDSGAICCALNLLNSPYSTVTLNNKFEDSIVRSRVLINRQKSNINHHDIQTIPKKKQDYIRENIRKYSENHNYLHATGRSIYDDDGSVGAYLVGQVALKYGYNVALSGTGGDEIYSDYGFNGKKLLKHSEFGGLFPENLESVFPWRKFGGDSMRDFLLKDEYIYGIFGIEGRYPLIDSKVVQMFLSTPATVKNSIYKSVITQFLEENNYPYIKDKFGFYPKIETNTEKFVRRLKRKFYKIIS